jgi:hypothetical protein
VLTLTERGKIGELLLTAQALYTSDGEIEPFSPAADDEEIDLCMQRRGQASMLYVQVKSGFSSDTPGSINLRIRLNPEVFPEHPAFMYALLFIQPPGYIEAAWLIRARDLLRLIRVSARPGTTVRVINPHPHRPDRFEPYRLAPAEIGLQLLQFLDDVKHTEPPSKPALRAFAAT